MSRQVGTLYRESLSARCARRREIDETRCSERRSWPKSDSLSEQISVTFENRRALWIVFSLTFFYFIVEVIGGLLRIVLLFWPTPSTCSPTSAASASRYSPRGCPRNWRLRVEPSAIRLPGAGFMRRTGREDVYKRQPLQPLTPKVRNFPKRLNGRKRPSILLRI